VLVAVPVILAVCFLMVVAWSGGELRLWFIIPPLTILGALQLAVAIRALQPARVSVLSLAIMGVVELALGIFVLVATSPLTGGAVTGGVIALIAAVVSFAAAYRIHLAGGAVGPSPTGSAISISIRTPAKGPSGQRTAGTGAQRQTAKSRPKSNKGQRKK
jgi:hypothetical protein